VVPIGALCALSSGTDLFPHAESFAGGRGSRPVCKNVCNTIIHCEWWDQYLGPLGPLVLALARLLVQANAIQGEGTPGEVLVQCHPFGGCFCMLVSAALH
jgi:hypothetical protein